MSDVVGDWELKRQAIVAFLMADLQKVLADCVHRRYACRNRAFREKNLH
jgi:hypothetical protein